MFETAKLWQSVGFLSAEGAAFSSHVRPWIKFRMRFEARRAGIKVGNFSTDAVPSALN
jgi:hypothetical protein